MGNYVHIASNAIQITNEGTAAILQEADRAREERFQQADSDREKISQRRTARIQNDALQQSVELGYAKDEINNLKKQVQNKAQELSKEQQKANALRELATDIVSDRAAMLKTIEFLKQKWIKPEEQEDFDKDCKDIQKDQKEKIDNDPVKQQKAEKLVDWHVNELLTNPKKSKKNGLR